MGNAFQRIAFGPAVKAVQEKQGTRRHWAKFEESQLANTRLTDAEADFIEGTDGFYMASVGESGQPYIQFRGGEPGFLKVLDEETLGFADFRGNLQYISTGNFAANAKTALFIMDYGNRRRLKLFAEVEIVDAKEQPEIAAKLIDPEYKAKVERLYLLHIKAYDWNCPQHITPKFTGQQIAAYAQPLKDRIAELEERVRVLEGK